MSKWTSVKLDDVCQLKKGEQLNKLDLEKTGEYPCINGGIHPSGYTNSWNTEANTITISEGGNSCGFVNFLKVKFWSGGHCYSLLNVKDTIDNKYLFHALKGRENLIMKLRVGSGLPNIQQKAIKEFEFELPISKSEQQKIAKILSTTDTVIEKTQAAITKYKAIKQGMLNDLFTRGIDIKTGKLRPKQEDAPDLYKESKLGWIPKEWNEIMIEEFASDEKNAIVDGPFGSNLKTIHYRASGVPVIQSGFVTSNKFIAEKYLYVDKEKFESEIRSKTVPGDIIMAKIGAQCGTCAILPKNHPVGILAGNSLKITVSKINSNEFLEAYLHFMHDTGVIYNIITTTAQPAVSMSSLKVLKIKYPEPKEQIEISKRLKTIDNKIVSEENYLIKLQQIKSGLMADLLSGKKIVTA